MSGHPRRSILKRPNEDQTTSIKKLSFSELEPNKSLKEDEANESQNRIFMAPNLKLTKLGLCYVPPSTSPVPKNATVPPKQQIRHTLRPDYRLLFKEDYNSASVLIIGDPVLSDEFRRELEDALENSPSSVKIICKQAAKPSYEDIAEADFFVFLLQLEKFYSIEQTWASLKGIRSHVKTLSFRGLVVCISSLIGPYADVVAPEDLHNLLVEQQIPSVTLSFINRERKWYLMQKIIAIVTTSHGNYCDPVTRWGLSCSTHSEDLLLT